MILANIHNLDPAWLLGTDVVGVVFLIFAFRALFRDRHRMRLRVTEQVERLAHIERKLDQHLSAPPGGG